MILAFWGWYGSVLEVSWAVLEASYDILGHLGDLLGAILCQLEPLWEPRGNTVSHRGFLEKSQRNLGAREPPPESVFWRRGAPSRQENRDSLRDKKRQNWRDTKT